MVFHGKWYDEVNVGESFGTSVTVTETHIVLGSGMFGDFNPLHVDASAFTLPGPQSPTWSTAARFKAPVRAGDTIATRWTVTAKSDKPRHKGGIIELAGQATNQRHELAVECEGKILVASKAS